MPDRRPSPLSAGLEVLAALCVAAAGCQSVPLHPFRGAGDEFAVTPALTVRPAAADSGPTFAPVAHWSATPGQAERPAPVPKAAPAAVLGPNMVVTWSVESPSARRGYRGQSTVGLDGRLSLGPYGWMQVNGLTVEQARAVFVRHVTHSLRDARVTMTLVVANRPAPRAGPGAQAGVRNPYAAPITRTGLQIGYGHDPQERLTPLPAMGPSLAGALPPSTGQAVESRSKQPAGKEAKKEQATELPPPRQLPAPSPDLAGHPLHPHGPDGAPGAGSPAPYELQKESLPPYVIEPPDILLVQSLSGKPEQRIGGPHLVRPDGTISLGVYGSVYVAGMTLEQARDAVYRAIRAVWTVKPEDVVVDVLAYNSKFYYVILDGGGYGEQVFRLPVTGSETVLDALAQVGGLQIVADKHRVWVARRTPDDGTWVLPVDYVGITERGASGTNYQVLPGDRIYVKADHWRTFDAAVAKVLAPIERILGVTLLGSETVHSIATPLGRSGTGSSTGTTGF